MSEKVVKRVVLVKIICIFRDFLWIWYYE